MKFRAEHTMIPATMNCWAFAGDDVLEGRGGADFIDGSIGKRHGELRIFASGGHCKLSTNPVTGVFSASGGRRPRVIVLSRLKT